MAEADFTPDGVTLRLSKEEWWFVTSAMTYALDGSRLADHDFRNILMMDSADAERLHDALAEAERRARASGNHWSPRPDW
ncbi:hypothetical protein [Actinopolymorpha sp. B9G3]|uniref:hypothetical protein n=1 Tax=Actinopolymorpha sp. B9G3 TaxID=3158970 RepID=UPI0032D8D80E